MSAFCSVGQNEHDIKKYDAQIPYYVKNLHFPNYVRLLKTHYIITHNSEFCNIYFCENAIFLMQKHRFRRRFVLKKQNFIKGSIILMVSAAAAKLLGAVFKIPLTNILGGVGLTF